MRDPAVPPGHLGPGDRLLVRFPVDDDVVTGEREEDAGVCFEPLRRDGADLIASLGQQRSDPRRRTQIRLDHELAVPSRRPGMGVTPPRVFAARHPRAVRHKRSTVTVPAPPEPHQDDVQPLTLSPRISGRRVLNPGVFPAWMQPAPNPAANGPVRPDRLLNPELGVRGRPGLGTQLEASTRRFGDPARGVGRAAGGCITVWDRLRAATVAAGGRVGGRFRRAGCRRGFRR
jgi:hypothetical protein